MGNKERKEKWEKEDPSIKDAKLCDKCGGLGTKWSDSEGDVVFCKTCKGTGTV